MGIFAEISGEHNFEKNFRIISYNLKPFDRNICKKFLGYFWGT